jgi:hypothetical protein
MPSIRKKRTIKRRRTKTKRQKRTRTKAIKYKNMIGCHKELYKKRYKKGGSPFVGNPYDINNGGNYYGSQSNFSLDRQQMLSGGNSLTSFIPSNLLNVGRMIEHNGQSIYNGLAGYNPPKSPLPYQDQGRFNAN